MRKLFPKLETFVNFVIFKTMIKKSNKIPKLEIRKAEKMRKNYFSHIHK